MTSLPLWLSQIVNRGAKSILKIGQQNARGGRSATDALHAVNVCEGHVLDTEDRLRANTCKAFFDKSESMR